MCSPGTRVSVQVPVCAWAYVFKAVRENVSDMQLKLHIPKFSEYLLNNTAITVSTETKVQNAKKGHRKQKLKGVETKCTAKRCKQGRHIKSSEHLDPFLTCTTAQAHQARINPVAATANKGRQLLTLAKRPEEETDEREMCRQPTNISRTLAELNNVNAPVRSKHTMG